MKNKKKELSLAVETITHLNQDEMKVIKGGLLSIGHACSHKNKCQRLYTECWNQYGYTPNSSICEGDYPPDYDFDSGILNS